MDSTAQFRVVNVEAGLCLLQLLTTTSQPRQLVVEAGLSAPLLCFAFAPQGVGLLQHVFEPFEFLFFFLVQALQLISAFFFLFLMQALQLVTAFFRAAGLFRRSLAFRFLLGFILQLPLVVAGKYDS